MGLEIAVIGGFALVTVGMVVWEKVTKKAPLPSSAAEEDEWMTGIK